MLQKLVNQLDLVILYEEENLELKTILTEYIIYDSSIYTSDSHWEVNQFIQYMPTSMSNQLFTSLMNGNNYHTICVICKLV